MRPKRRNHMMWQSSLHASVYAEGISRERESFRSVMSRSLAISDRNRSQTLRSPEFLQKELSFWCSIAIRSRSQTLGLPIPDSSPSGAPLKCYIRSHEQVFAMTIAIAIATSIARSGAQVSPIKFCPEPLANPKRGAMRVTLDF